MMLAGSITSCVSAGEFFLVARYCRRLLFGPLYGHCEYNCVSLTWAARHCTVDVRAGVAGEDLGAGRFEDVFSGYKF